MTPSNGNGLIHCCYICYNWYKSVLNLLPVSIVRNLIWRESPVARVDCHPDRLPTTLIVIQLLQIRFRDSLYIYLF